MATSNATLFERVVDKDMFEKVFKGVRTSLFAMPESFQKFAEGGAPDELQAKIRSEARDMMRKMRLAPVEAEEGEDAEEVKVERVVKQLKSKLFEDEFEQVFKGGPAHPDSLVLPTAKSAVRIVDPPVVNKGRVHTQIGKKSGNSSRDQLDLMASYDSSGSDDLKPQPGEAQG